MRTHVARAGLCRHRAHPGGQHPGLGECQELQGRRRPRRRHWLPRLPRLERPVGRGFPTELLPPGYIKPQEDTILQGVIEGIGIYFSSGDNNDESLVVGYQTADWPASSPFVTAVERHWATLSAVTDPGTAGKAIDELPADLAALRQASSQNRR